MMSTDLLITTADELFEMPHDGNRYELINGELRRMSPASGGHSEIALRLGGSLMLHVLENRLGRVYGADAGFRIGSNPDTVLSPDSAFVAQNRVHGIPERFKFVPLAPDLAIEVLSPGDSYSETSEKIEKFLEAGTRAVVIVDPRTKTVSIHRSKTDVVTLTSGESLEVEDIVPGWSVPLKRVFLFD